MLGLPKVHQLPTVRCFLPQQQSRSVCPLPWPCWKLPILKCSITICGPFPSSVWETKLLARGKEKGIYEFLQVDLGYENILPALHGVRSRSLWSQLFSCPDLSAWKSLHIFDRCALSPALNCVLLGNGCISKFSANGRSNPYFFLFALCLSLSNIKKLLGF